MEITELVGVIKSQTDLVINQLDYYKKGYLDALSFVASKLTEEKPKE